MNSSLLVLTALVLAAPPRAPSRLGPPPPAKVAQVVTLAPSLTETVLALGAGARLVGVTRFDDAPEVKEVTRVGGYTDPSVEMVAMLRPDLVLAEPSPGNRKAVQRIAGLGIPVIAVPLGNRAEILAGLRVVGEVLGLPEEAARLEAAMMARMDALQARVGALPQVRVLVVYDWEPLVVAGPGSFADELLRACGAQNAAADSRSSYPVLSAEGAMRAAPELIVDAADVPDPVRARLLKLPGMSSARVAIASSSLFRPGPRLADAMEELFGLIHPTGGAQP